jgi:menaquinone-9 beta-reductase
MTMSSPLRGPYAFSDLPRLEREDHLARTAQGEEAFPWQRPLAAVPRERWDTIVIGAGPAGALAALSLARRGYRVLLLDRERFPRDKTCGDLLIGDSLQALDRAGLLESVRECASEVEGFSVFSPSRIRFELPGRYLTLKRRRLDALLARAAAEAGAAFARGKVEALTPRADGTVSCAVAGPGPPLEARTAVVATGASVDLLRRLNVPVRRQADALAARCYVRSRVPPGRLVVSFDRAIVPGYGWVFPLGGGEYNVGCGVFLRGDPGKANLRELFRRFMETFPPAAELLRAGGPASPLCGARLRCGLRDAAWAAAGGVLAVGETIGTTYPVSGEGIGKAMQTGELAADTIDAAFRAGDVGRLRDFPARLEAALRPRYRGYVRAEDWLARPWLNDLLAWRIGRSDCLRGRVAAVLAADEDPSPVFSARALLASFWR